MTSSARSRSDSSSLRPRKSPAEILVKQYDEQYDWSIMLVPYLSEPSSFLSPGFTLHHRGDTKAPIQRFLRFRCFCSHFVTFIHNSCRTTWAHFGLFYRPPWLAPSRRPRARRWTTAVSSPIPTA